MRSVLIAAATLLAFGGASALAQSDRNGAAQTFTRACMASPQMQGYSNAGASLRLRIRRPVGPHD